MEYIKRVVKRANGTDIIYSPVLTEKERKERIKAIQKIPYERDFYKVAK